MNGISRIVIMGKFHTLIFWFFNQIKYKQAQFVHCLTCAGNPKEGLVA
jgi:hypothetical protein